MNKNAAFQFTPFSRKQMQVLTWWCGNSPVHDCNGVIADGSIRSGKTLCLSLSFVIWAMNSFSQQNLALCGKTIGSLRRNLLAPLKRMLLGRGYAVKEHRAENMLEIASGDIVNFFYLFGGKDEGSQDLIQGITLAGVLFDEVALMPESFVNQATARCSVDGSKWWFNCNPEGPFHWFYVNWIQKCKKKGLIYLHFTMEDNLSLSATVKARYYAQHQGVFYERYILGRWVVAEGLVYALFSTKNHVVNTMPQCTETSTRRGRYFISIDYGTKNPFSAGLWCLCDGVATRINEYYYDGRAQKSPHTDEEYYKELESLANGFVIEEMIIDPSAASMVECIRRHEVFSVRAAKNDVVPGISVTASLLLAGKVKIHENCANTIREFFTYRWDEKATSDVVIKENDHAMDDIRYFCYTILRAEFRWENWNAKA